MKSRVKSVRTVQPWSIRPPCFAFWIILRITRNMPALLTQKVRQQIELALEAGVPVTAAASAFGILPRMLAGWISTGNNYNGELPPKPAATASPIAYPGGAHIPAMEHWKSECECVRLVAAVHKHEGKMITKLAAAMWKTAFSKAKGKAGISADMQKFLFKHYGHVHRLNDKSATPAQDTESKAPDVDDQVERVQLYIPDNGRGPKAAP